MDYGLPQALRLPLPDNMIDSPPDFTAPLLLNSPLAWPINPARYDAVLFDCDGTLADTMPLHHQAWQLALRNAGFAHEFDWSLFTKRAGMTLEKTVVELNAEFGVALDPETVAQAQRAQYRQLMPQITPIEPVVALARSLSHSHRLAVASGSRRGEVESTLQRILVDGLFQVIVAGDDVELGKPAPDIFLLAAARLDVSPDRCLVVEDGEYGLLAARRAGMDALFVTEQQHLLFVPRGTTLTDVPRDTSGVLHTP
jgi:HAD superfamily hydrolase (TIGR01509 family)